MKWRRIPKENAIQPSKGSYRDWKEILAKEGFHQCVYCAIPEASFGGIRNFHVEHYKPKSKFKDLTNDMHNLFYACPVCNTFKGNDWSEPLDNHSTPSYPDPSKVDYSDLFSSNWESGVAEGRYIASKYVVEKLHLNRNQLILERRFHGLLGREKKAIETIRSLRQQLEKIKNTRAISELTNRYIQILEDMHLLENKLHRIPHYAMEDVKR